MANESQRGLEIGMLAVRLATELENWKRQAQSLAQLAAGIPLDDAMFTSIDTQHLTASGLTGALVEFGNIADFLDQGNPASFLAQIRRPG